MNIYRLTQTKVSGYDTYDACIVAAPTADDARRWHPYGEKVADQKAEAYGGTWCDCVDVQVEMLGTCAPGMAIEEGVLLASFNAG